MNSLRTDSFRRPRIGEWLFLRMAALLFSLIACTQLAIAGENAPRWLAIWPLDSFSAGAGMSSEDLQVIQEIVPDMLTSTLSSNGSVRLVERQKLLEVLNEQKLGASDLADESTRLRLGRILGARYMLFGSYLKLGPSWQIDIRLVDTESSQILASASADQQQGDLLNVVQYLGKQKSGNNGP